MMIIEHEMNNKEKHILMRKWMVEMRIILTIDLIQIFFKRLVP
jgi:hypothetical protein